MQIYGLAAVWFMWMLWNYFEQRIITSFIAYISTLWAQSVWAKKQYFTLLPQAVQIFLGRTKLHENSFNWKIDKLNYINVFISPSFQVSATDPDCGLNAIVSYTLGEGVKKLNDFEIRSDSGEVCISGDLDYELRSSYEFPIIATDRGKDVCRHLFQN